MRIFARAFATVAGGLLLVALAGPASAARPSVVHFGPITETFVDEILTPACGFEVIGSINLSGVDITFENGHPSGLVFMSASRNDVTFTANGNTVVFIERGHFSARLDLGGETAVVTTTGRNFGEGLIGRLSFRVNTSTGEIVGERTQVGRAVDLDAICAALDA
jgi:hypothetical protein